MMIRSFKRMLPRGAPLATRVQCAKNRLAFCQKAVKTYKQTMEEKTTRIADLSKRCEDGALLIGADVAISSIAFMHLGHPGTPDMILIGTIPLCIGYAFKLGVRLSQDMKDAERARIDRENYFLSNANRLMVDCIEAEKKLKGLVS